MSSQQFYTITNNKNEFSVVCISKTIPTNWVKMECTGNLETCLNFLNFKWTEQGNTDKCPISFPIYGIDYHELEIDPLLKELVRLKKILWIRPPFGDNAWLITSHEDVKNVLRDTRFSRQLCPFHDESRLTPNPLFTSILGLDGEDHRRLRDLIDLELNARKTKYLRDKLTKLANEIIDYMLTCKQPFDLVEGFVMPFAGHTICEMLGVPYEDRTMFRKWLDSFSSTTHLSPDEAMKNMKALFAYMEELIQSKRIGKINQEKDVISGLILSNEEGKLTDEELSELISVLLIAGHDTIAAQLMCSLYVILSNSEISTEIKNNLDLPVSAVKELLRYVPVDAFVTFARYAKEDVYINDTLIKKGDAILPSLISTSYDESVFPFPEIINLKRHKNPHLMFGAGIHKCPGSAITMVELEVGLSTIFRRLPNLRLAIAPDKVKFRGGMQIRSIYNLPVYF